MRYKNGAAFILIFLGLFFFLLSMPFGAALSQGKLERTVTAKVVGDEDAVLKLIGFQNQSYNLNGSYTEFGTITNNSKKIIILTVTVKPNYTKYHSATRYGLKIGSTAIEFRYNTSSPKQITIIMLPGQLVSVQAYLTQNALSSLTVDFQFSVSDIFSTYVMHLYDSLQNPRRINCY